MTMSLLRGILLISLNDVISGMHENILWLVYTPGGVDNRESHKSLTVKDCERCKPYCCQMKHSQS
jgi:hypothetical protein